VNQVDAIFKYLDRDQKGYISFGDFCELCEEKRRQLDPFDHSEQERKNAEADAKKSWIQKYLEEANMNDLDLMSKRNGTRFTKTTAET
jgi:Ca2+-binding EF-hand superfamily protein